MGYDIPEPFCWDESFRVFYENLDEQHKGLFQGIFDVAADRPNKDKLAELYKRCDTHFKTEEDMMRKGNYGELSQHKQAHDGFLDKLKEVSTPVSDAIIKFSKEWLVNHIKGTDFKYKDKL